MQFCHLSSGGNSALKVRLKTLVHQDSGESCEGVGDASGSEEIADVRGNVCQGRNQGAANARSTGFQSTTLWLWQGEEGRFDWGDRGVAGVEFRHLDVKSWPVGG